MIKGGKQLVAVAQIKDNASYMKQIKVDTGVADVIDVDSGRVLGSYETFTYRDDFVCPLIYVTDNYLCAMQGRRRPLVNITDGSPQNYNKVSFLSKDEKFFIFYSKDKLLLRDQDSREVIGEFDVSQSQMAIVANDLFTIVAMVAVESRDVTIFDLWSKRDNLKPNKKFAQVFKPKHVFKLDDRVRGLVDIVFKSVLRDIDGKTRVINNKDAEMTIAPDNRHLLLTFLGAQWMSFLFGLNVYKYNAKFIGEVTPNFMKVTSPFPQFSHDGAHVVYVTKRKRVVICETETAQEVNSYELEEEIKGFCASRVDGRLAVMLHKSIVVLQLTKTALAAAAPVAGGRTRKDVTSQSPDVLFEREIRQNVINKEVVIYSHGGGGAVQTEQVSDLAEAADTDRIASARSKRHHALETYVTPDGTKTIHYHARVQVIDTKNDCVKYTPRSGEHLLRVKVEAGLSSSEIVHIPGVSGGDLSSQRSSAAAVLELQPGDRIVSDNSNKVKFRTDTEPRGQFKVMSVPSALSIYSTDELKLENPKL